MTHRVDRYPLPIVDEQVVSMPEGATILSVARREGQRNVVVGVGSHEPVEMWALVDPDAPSRDRRIRIAGTGHPLPEADSLVHLGTVQIAQGQLVFHVFEIVDAPSPVDEAGHAQAGDRDGPGALQREPASR